MGAARFEFDFEPRPSRSLPDDAVVENGVLRGRVILSDDLGLRHAMAFVEEVAPGSLVGRDDPFDERPVRLADRAIFELFGKPLRGADVAREDDGSADGAVEPVGEAEIDVRVVGLALALTEKLLDLDFETVDPRRRLRKEPRRLVDHQAGAVVVEDVEHWE